MLENTKPAKRAKTTRPDARTQDPEGVRRDILAVATREFAENGLTGARVDVIAAKTATSKRMIYYYFKDKLGLYIAVLEAAYSGIRNLEQFLKLDGLSPVDAIVRLAEFTFDYQNSNTDFVRIVMVENIHRGQNLDQAQGMSELNVSILKVIGDVYERGVASGDFRPGLDLIDLHMTMSALAFFNVSNRATFSRIFKCDIETPEALARRRKVVAETVLRYVLKSV